MSAFSLRKIKAVDAKPGYRLAVLWEKGPASIIDLSDMISKGGVFQALAEKQAFASVRIGENSRVIEWPSPADDEGYPIISIDADALFEKASVQTTNTLAATMKQLLQSAKGAGKSASPSKA